MSALWRAKSSATDSVRDEFREVISGDRLLVRLSPETIRELAEAIAPLL